MKLCTDRELRIKLFCVVFSIEPERKGEGANSSTAGAGRGRKGRSASTALGRDEAEDVGRSNKLSKREEVERRQRAAGVIAIFCDLWHNYFNSLQVIEATKMQQEKLNTRRRVREKSRINRLSEFKAATPDACGWFTEPMVVVAIGRGGRTHFRVRCNELEREGIPSCVRTHAT